MAETEKSLAVRAQAHLRAAGKPVPAVPDLIPLVPTALAIAAKQICSGPGWRGLQKVFTGSITAGYCDLSGTDFAAILFDITRADVRFTPSGGSDTQVEPRVDWRQLRQTSLDSTRAYCAPYKRGLLFRKAGTTAPTSFNGTVSINSGHIPTAATIPTEEVLDAVVLKVAELSGNKPAPPESVAVTEQ
jgi:hypothetical protein